MPQSERSYRAARYPDQASTESPYLQLQNLVFSANIDLSVYRFTFDGAWYIVVVGSPPDQTQDNQMQQILSSGENVPQSPQIVEFLFQRRAASLLPGGWIEHHYRPGQRVTIPKFELGLIVMTRGVQAALEGHPDGKGIEELLSLILDRHAQGDWGDLDDDDRLLNEEALEQGRRLLSVYYLSTVVGEGTKIYVITEADRSATTALLPEEY